MLRVTKKCFTWRLLPLCKRLTSILKFKKQGSLYLNLIISTTTNFMMILKRLLILLLFAAMAKKVLPQTNINGVWEGKYLSEFIIGQPRLVVEIYNFKDSIFTGITHLYYAGNQYEHYKMIGYYSKKDSMMVYTEAETIAVNLGLFKNCLGTYSMYLKRSGSTMYQYGFWEANIKGCTTSSPVILRKREEELVKVPGPEKKPVPGKKPAVAIKPADKPVAQKKIAAEIKTNTELPVVKNNPTVKTAPVIMPAKISQRETDIQSLIEIDSKEKDSIKVEVYDNGDIDGDSVSVYEEQVQRINRKMISATAITFYVSLNKNVNPIAHLRMVAESMGAIPPCTALMIVTTKTKRYEVRLSSNYNKNATVELFLKE